MKNKYSLVSFFAILTISLSIRAYYIQHPSNHKNFCLTTFDALGYYMYLPAIFIYQDVRQMAWLPAIDNQYAVTGGAAYQTVIAKNGNHVGKFLGGVALMQMPFFITAHIFTKINGYPSDGFSAPYQYAVFIAAFFYAFLGLFYLRRFLLLYFDDKTVAFTLFALTLSSNWIQYLAIDSGQSHIYIFPLYVFILWFSKQWHEKPTTTSAFMVGFIVGLATICRPTEGVMLFIPLLWYMHNRAATKEKWALVKNNITHVWIAIVAGILAISPQLIYWKYTSGQFIFDVGSKWFFLNPYFRVLFGFEKGWFIYTPITILFVLGLFFIRKYPFYKSVLTFSLLNIYIIIAWSDWHYGGSYSCRALVQSYAVFALPLAVVVKYCLKSRLRIAFYVLFLYLLLVNLFQIYQYNAGIIRYDENSFEYYKSIYLNPNAQPYIRHE
jgi:hypothetical protein